MITKTYSAESDGKMVASGEGVVTVTCPSGLQWAVGDSDTTAPTTQVRHSTSGRENVSLQLEDGEHLWVFGGGLLAVTAANPAAGEVV
jgi:hypothetical protein